MLQKIRDFYINQMRFCDFWPCALLSIRVDMSPNGTEESSFLATTSSTTTCRLKTKNGPTQRSMIVVSTLRFWKESDPTARLWSWTTLKAQDWFRPVPMTSAMASSTLSDAWSATTMAHSNGTWNPERKSGSWASAGITHGKSTTPMSWTGKMTLSFKRWSRSIIILHYARPGREAKWPRQLPQITNERVFYKVYQKIKQVPV